MVKKFIIKIGCFSAIIFLFCASIYFFISPNYNTYYSALNDKHEYLETIKSPKIIFLGGSNLPFGMDSGAVEKKFGRPVINMGLHAAIGYEFMINEIKPAIGKNDIVIITPEYNHIYDTSMQTSAIAQVLNVFPEGIKFIGKSESIKRVATAYLEVLQIRIQGQFYRFLNKNQTELYNRNSFNKYGDFIAHLELDRKEKLTGSGSNLLDYQNEKISENFISLTNDFYKYSKHKNTHVLFSYPPIAMISFDRSVVQKIHRELKAKLQLPIINSPLYYEDSMFFDTIYHLTKEGIKRRTQMIISDLENYMLHYVKDDIT